MNYYPFHIGDYASHTSHLTDLEDLAYRRLMDKYYLNEGSLPADPVECARLVRMRGNVEEVTAVLNEFFKPGADGWYSERCDLEISKARDKRMKASDNAAKRWHSDGNADAKQTDGDGSAPNPNPNTNTKPKTTNVVYTSAFENAWHLYPQRPNANKGAAFRAWKARLAAGCTEEEMVAGVAGYKAFCAAQGTEPQYIKQPATFFGPDCHFRNDWSVPASRQPPGRQSAADRQSATIAGLTNPGDDNGPHQQRARTIDADGNYLD